MRELAAEYQEAMELCMKKNKDYGNAKEVAGKIMKMMFPNGIKLETDHQFNEFNMFVMIMSKFIRFANLSQSKGVPNFESIEDTLKDLGNYAFILKNMIHNNREEEKVIQETEGPLCECGHREVDHTPLTEAPNVACDVKGCWCCNFKKAGE
jgi:hypothetical protein